jgi:Domain of unknown function (DUF4123)
MLPAEQFIAALRTAATPPDDPQAGQAVNTYLLIDQSALPPPPWLNAPLKQWSFMGVLQAEVRPALDGATPLLVALDASSERAFRFAEKLYTVAQFANALSVLRSPLLLPDLQRTLQTHLRIELPGQMAALLRLFDTRTLPALPNILSQAQYAALMQGIDAWYFVDRWGALQRLPAPQRDVVAAAEPIQLSELQEQALVDDGLADAVIDLLITQRHPSLLDKTPPEQFEQIQPLAATAQQLGLRDPPQALAYVAKAMQEGEDFHRREPWAGALARFAAGHGGWQEALA